jgi:large subunit ribosomal protein L2
MALKTFRPKTASLRFKSVIDYKQELTTDEPYKPLVSPKNRINGRNNYGQLRSSSRRRKQEALSDDRFPARQDRIPAKVETIEYDPNRSAFIALLSYADGERRYILQPVA